MDLIQDFIHNRVLITAAAGWACAQITKAVIFCIVNKRFEPERLFGDGGMPSAHSATVTAMALTVGFTSGFSSPVFGLALMFALIVMHDAMGVRLETGKQAKLLNEMMEVFDRMSEVDLSLEDRLKEFVGHTPLQVVCGACVGLLVAALGALLF
ncbi:MAG: divergent PAP2 family protein [Lachnospiraceae bacterium]|nr:divergent PAP2 family protein [Lachnospiraceae bacterium]